MSFADGLLHERQEKDEVTREEVQSLIRRLEGAYAGDYQIASEGSGLLRAAIKYLKRYAKGDNLI